MRRGVLLAFAALVLMASCTAQAEVRMTDAGAMDLKVDMGLFPLFVSYLQDLQDTMGGAAEPLFDKASISREITRVAAVRLDEVQVPSKVAALNGKGMASASVALGGGVSALAKEGPLAGLVEYRQAGTERILVFRVGPRLVKSLAAYVRPGDESALDYVLPDAGVTTAAKYQDQLLWALGDYGSPTELKAMLAASRVRVRVVLPAPVKSAKAARGLTRDGDKAVIFEMPVLEVMTLQADMECEIRY